MNKTFWADISELAEFKKAVAKVGGLPQKVLTASVRKGANVVLKSVRANAPVGKTGNLKRAITLKAERNRQKGRKFFQVTFNKKYNEQLVKVSKKGKRSYYPASQEYGFLTKKGSKTKGKAYLWGASESANGAFQAIVKKEMLDRLDKEWRG